MTKRQVWTWLKEVHSVGAVVAALIGLGFAWALLAGGFVGLPERVSAVEHANMRQDAALLDAQRNDADAGRKLDRVLCLVEALAADQDPVARGCVR